MKSFVEFFFLAHCLRFHFVDGELSLFHFRHFCDGLLQIRHKPLLIALAAGIEGRGDFAGPTVLQLNPVVELGRAEDVDPEKPDRQRIPELVNSFSFV